MKPTWRSETRSPSGTSTATSEHARSRTSSPGSPTASTASRKKTRSTKHEIRNKFEIRMLKTARLVLAACFEHLNFHHSDLFRGSAFVFRNGSSGGSAERRTSPPRG